MVQLVRTYETIGIRPDMFCWWKYNRHILTTSDGLDAECFTFHLQHGEFSPVVRLETCLDLFTKEETLDKDERPVSVASTVIPFKCACTHVGHSPSH